MPTTPLRVNSCHTVTWTRQSFGEQPLRDVRLKARQWLFERGCDDDFVDNAELVLAELGANAVEHGGHLTAVTLDIVPPTAEEPGVLRVSAHDTGPNLPILGAARAGRADEPLRECGRGLGIVAALSRAWGAVRHQGRHKQVWCDLSVPQHA
ncbi:ATP-binding protein [Streptomyces sp. NPDC090442]|uniref:ATP-binding protein n=1 Tax=Streptomyces sp. NPDC090442 TaxID=3365962 RepID=UPI00382594B2